MLAGPSVNREPLRTTEALREKRSGYVVRARNVRVRNAPGREGADLGRAQPVVGSDIAPVMR